MGVNLKREGAAIRSLLDQADGIELSAETAMEKARFDADEMRWEAARRCTETFEASGLSQNAFAKAAGLDNRKANEMLRAWKKFASVRLADRPGYWEAVQLADDPGLEERAARQGRRPATVHRSEANARTALRHGESAEVIMRDPIVRESARRAIVAAEATEAKARLMANANPVDLPLPNSGFNWLDADASLSHARKLINSVGRMIKEHGPLDDRDREMVIDSAREVRISLEILEAVLTTGDIDEALAKLLEQEA